MRKPKNLALVANLSKQLTAFDLIISLDGIQTQAAKDCFLLQLEDSIRRIEYVKLVRAKQHDARSANPHLGTFNPIAAAAWHIANGNIDEASWLVFLITHFGKNKFTGWQLVKNIYGGLGQHLFDWNTVSAAPKLLGQWIDANRVHLNAIGKFGNHRKYESLKYSITGLAINSYTNWVGAGHLLKFAQIEPANATPKTRFKAFYASLSNVYRFGRTGKFDYITMMGKLGIIDVEPDSVYMTGATGPFDGARLLFGNNIGANLNRQQLNRMLDQLETHLGIYYGMQVLEDAICNWQKSPTQYIHFRG
jgi:hypothetical protein